MNHFFRRILLAVWLSITVAIVLALLVANLLLDSTWGSAEQDRQLVNFVAQEFATAMRQSPPQAPARLINRDTLAFDRALQIYVIDLATGRDALARALPSTIGELVTQRQSAPGLASTIDDPRLILPSADTPGYLIAGYSERFPLALLMTQRGSRPLLFGALLLVSVGVSFVLARFIVLPVRHLREAGHRVAAGDLTARVAHHVGNRQDDIALLARDFDAMTERIGRLLASQQRLMRDVSHELRSPLARLQALQSLARQRFTAGDQTHILDRMDGELERLDQLIEEILTFARLDAQEQITPRRTDLVDLIQTIIDDAAVEVGDDHKDLSYQGPERLLLEVDAGLLHRAIENVVRNALRFTPAGGGVRILLARLPAAVRLAVEDDGPGVPESAIGQLFDPFFQVDDSRSSAAGVGSGVGLAIARRAVQLHGGSIAAENRTPAGLKVVIDLPAGCASSPDDRGAAA